MYQKTTCVSDSESDEGEDTDINSDDDDDNNDASDDNVSDHKTSK